MMIGHEYSTRETRVQWAKYRPAGSPRPDRSIPNAPSWSAFYLPCAALPVHWRQWEDAASG